MNWCTFVLVGLVGQPPPRCHRLPVALLMVKVCVGVAGSFLEALSEFCEHICICRAVQLDPVLGHTGGPLHIFVVVLVVCYNVY